MNSGRLEWGKTSLVGSGVGYLCEYGNARKHQSPAATSMTQLYLDLHSFTAYPEIQLNHSSGISKEGDTYYSDFLILAV